MMYYAAGLTVVGGVEHTPLKSLLSKCVDLDEFGKIFAVSSVTSSMASLVSGTITPILYGNTLHTNPGAVYFFSGMTTNTFQLTLIQAFKSIPRWRCFEMAIIF